MSEAAKAVEADAGNDELINRFRAGWFGLRETSSYHLTRFVVLRWLGALYLVAFLVSFFQLRGLIGRDGILPAAWFLSDVREQLGAGASWSLPTLFWLNHSDGFMLGAAALGAVLGALVVFGLSNAAVFAVLWLLYLSLIHVGQVFYSFGWEILLLEVGFLAIFLAPPRKFRPLAAAPVQVPVIWLLRWLAFRLMFGAGLIKIRGDACWTDLTCLQFHYETQPNPSPLSWYFHQLPAGFPHRWRAVQSLRRADRPVGSLRAAKGSPCCGAAARGVSGDADPERQPLVLELADDRRLSELFRRCGAAARRSSAFSRRGRAPSGRSSRVGRGVEAAQTRDLGPGCGRGGAQPESDREHALDRARR